MTSRGARGNFRSRLRQAVRATLAPDHAPIYDPLPTKDSINRATSAGAS